MLGLGFNSPSSSEVIQTSFEPIHYDDRHERDIRHFTKITLSKYQKTTLHKYSTLFPNPKILIMYSKSHPIVVRDD